MICKQKKHNSIPKGKNNYNKKCFASKVIESEALKIVEMKKDDRLIVYEKTEKLLYFSKTLLNKFPKSERFDLCADIKNTIYEMLKCEMYAWKARAKNDKLKYIEKADILSAFLKTLTMIAYNFKYITDKNYMTWNEKIGEIGKMLGGWYKSCT